MVSRARASICHLKFLIDFARSDIFFFEFVENRHFVANEWRQWAVGHRQTIARFQFCCFLSESMPTIWAQKLTWLWSMNIRFFFCRRKLRITTIVSPHLDKSIVCVRTFYFFFFLLQSIPSKCSVTAANERLRNACVYCVVWCVIERSECNRKLCQFYLPSAGHTICSTDLIPHQNRKKYSWYLQRELKRNWPDLSWSTSEAIFTIWIKNFMASEWFDTHTPYRKLYLLSIIHRLHSASHACASANAIEFERKRSKTKYLKRLSGQSYLWSKFGRLFTRVRLRIRK